MWRCDIRAAARVGPEAHAIFPFDGPRWCLRRSAGRGSPLLLDAASHSVFEVQHQAGVKLK